MAIGLDRVRISWEVNLNSHCQLFSLTHPVFSLERPAPRSRAPRAGGRARPPPSSVLAKATRSRETCVIRKLSGSHSPSHEPGQAPNDPYGALRAAEGQSRLKRRRIPLHCGWSVAPIRACAPDALVFWNENVNAVSAH